MQVNQAMAPWDEEGISVIVAEPPCPRGADNGPPLTLSLCSTGGGSGICLWWTPPPPIMERILDGAAQHLADTAGSRRENYCLVPQNTRQY